MFNVGGPEIMVVLLVALVVLGPEQLPKAMRSFGNVMAQIRKVSNGFQDEMRSAMNTLDVTSSAPDSPARDSSAPPPQATGQQQASPASEASSSDTSSSDTSPSSAPAASGPDATAPSAAPVIDPVSDRPGISSADRAAG